MNPCRPACRFATAALLAAALAPVAHAQSVWDGSVDDLWTTGGNWTPAGVPGTSDDPTFNGTAPGTIDLDGSTLTYNNVFIDADAYTFTNGVLQVREILAPVSPVGGGMATFQNTLAGQPPFPGFGITSILEFKGTGNTYTVDGPSGGIIADATAGVDPTQLVIGPGTTLSLLGANTYTGGTQINSGGVVVFDNDAAFGTGTISSPGNGGQIAPVGNRTLANDILVINNSGLSPALRIANEGGGHLDHTGDIVVNLNDRNVEVESGVTYTWSGDFDDGSTIRPSFGFSGDGKIAFSGARTTAIGEITVGVAEIEFDDDAFVGATTDIRFSGSGTTVRPVGARTLANNVTWNPSGNGVMTLDGDLTVNGTFGTANDIGTAGAGNPVVSVVNGGSLTLNGAIDTQGDTQRMLVGGDGSGSVTITSAQALDGDQVQLDTGGNLRVTAAGVFDGGSVRGLDRDAKLTPVGDITLGSGEGVFFTNLPTEGNGGLGVSGAEGSLTVNADVTAGFEAAFAAPGGDGVIKLHDGASVTFNGAVTVADDLTIESDGTAGTVVLNGTTEVDNVTTVAANATLLVNGTFGDLTGSLDADPVSVAVSGTLGGTGTITGNVNATGGAVAPGASAGTLSVDGDLMFDASSSLFIELGGASVGQFDELDITGNLMAGGAFQVSLIDGYTPTAGDSFDVLDFGSVSGVFDSVVLPSLGGSLTFDTSNLLTTGMLSVVGGGGIPGDFNGNGVLDDNDIDLLYENLGDPSFDLTGDNASDQSDVDELVEVLLGTFYGDADLDLDVDSDDFNLLAFNFGEAGGWSDGDFDGDGVVDSDDFNLLAFNFGSNASLAASDLAALASFGASIGIPEPASIALLAVGGAALIGRGRRGH